MDNPEEIMQSLEEFAKMKPRDIPKELEEYIGYVAKTGDPVYQWNLVKYLFHEKLLSVITEFYETSPLIDIPPCPNVDPFNYERMKTNLIERLDNFTNAPFTIQRLCELLSNPKKQYNRVDKFMRAIEKNILVVSTIDPGFGKRFENDHCYESNSVMNGIPDGQVNDNDKVYYVTKDIISYVKYMQRPYEENETNSVNQEQVEVGKSDSTSTVDDAKSDSQTNTEIDKKLPEVTVGTSMENSENIISTSADSETSVTNSASSNDEVNKEAEAENEVDGMIVSEVSKESATLDSGDKLNSPNESAENISADDKNNEETDSTAKSEENVETVTETTADKSTLVDNLQSTDEISEPKPSTNDQGTEIQEELLEASDNPEIKISTEEKPVDTQDLRPSTETEQTDYSDNSCTVDEGQSEAEKKEESNVETETNSNDEPECSNSELPEEAEAKKSDDITSSNSVTDSSENTENSVTIQEITSNTDECNDAEELITKEVADEDLAENESKKDEPVIESAEDSTISTSSDTTIDDKTTVSIEEVTEMGESKTDENIAAESMNDVTEDICEERKEGSIIHTTTNVSGVAVQSVVEDICVDQPSCDAPEEEAMEVDESSLQPMIVSEVENEGEPMDQSEQVQS